MFSPSVWTTQQAFTLWNLDRFPRQAGENLGFVNETSHETTHVVGMKQQMQITYETTWIAYNKQTTKLRDLICLL